MCLLEAPAHTARRHRMPALHRHSNLSCPACRLLPTCTAVPGECSGAPLAGAAHPRRQYFCVCQPGPLPGALHALLLAGRPPLPCRQQVCCVLLLRLSLGADLESLSPHTLSVHHTLSVPHKSPQEVDLSDSENVLSSPGLAEFAADVRAAGCTAGSGPARELHAELALLAACQAAVRAARHAFRNLCARGHA